MELGWFRKPWTISGSIIYVLILFSGSSLGLCHCYNKRRSTERIREEEHPQNWIALKEKQEEVDVLKEEKKQKEKASTAEAPLTFGDVRLDQLGVSDV